MHMVFVYTLYCSFNKSSRNYNFCVRKNIIASADIAFTIYRFKKVGPEEQNPSVSVFVSLLSCGQLVSNEKQNKKTKLSNKFSFLVRYNNAINTFQLFQVKKVNFTRQIPAGV